MAESTFANAAIAIGLTRLGCPYVWDGKGPNSFDCSGLVTYSYNLAGIPITGNTFSLVLEGREISPTDQTKWRRGDLLFSNGNPPNHVQIFLGTYLIEYAPSLIPLGQDTSTWILEAPETGQNVHICPQWVTTYTAVRRVVPVTD